jgi:hypothetical protein
VAGWGKLYRNGSQKTEEGVVAEYEEGSNEEFFLRFRAQMNEVNELSNVILRGHLEVEDHLDDIVDLIFFRPEYLRKIRLGFYQKVQIAKAYCLDPDARDWNVIECLSEVRNSIAHRRVENKRAAKIARLQEEMSGWGLQGLHGEEIADEKEIVVLAAARCCGFLTFVEDSVRKVREVISESLEVPEPPEARE